MDKKFLEEILNAYSPSGQEENAITVWNSWCSKLGLKHYYQDKIGNSAWSWGDGPIKIMISGHLDEIAMAVGNITEEGYLVLKNMAGIDKKVLPGSQVVILGDKGPVKGIVQSLAIHLQHAEKVIDKVSEIHELKVDIGCENKEEVIEAGVWPGCLVVFERNINLDFGKNKIHGNALDDKIGVFCVYEVLRRLTTEDNGPSLKNKITVIGVGAVQEESGLRGMTVASHNLNPDISIDLDVTHASNGGMYSTDKYGDVKLGKGTVIEFGQDKSRRLAKDMIKIAKENNIPFQTSVARCGGTNTDAIQLYSADCETMLLSLPLTSMHTPNETMNWIDIEATINLLYKTVQAV